MNTLCFEGGLFARSVVNQIGYPDPRFFIYFDDAVYGYLASKVTDSIVVADVVLQRTREIANMSIGTVRRFERHLGHEPLPYHAESRLHDALLQGARRTTTVCSLAWAPRQPLRKSLFAS